MSAKTVHVLEDFVEGDEEGAGAVFRSICGESFTCDKDGELPAGVDFVEWVHANKATCGKCRKRAKVA